MDIKLKLYNPFVSALNKMKVKYGETFERLNGFHNSNLNFTDFIDHFIDSDTVADSTIDANANSSTHDVRTLLSDMMKPHTKMLSFNKIFYEITKKYGLSQAEQWLEDEWSGFSYLHDGPSSSMIPYCYAYDLDQIVERGLFFINKFKTGPAKHLTSYNDHVLEFVSWVSNRTSGAVGLPSYFIYSYYFWKQDIDNNFCLKDPEYYRRQCFQKFIYDLNQPYLRLVEAAFSNVSIMDREYLSELFGGRLFPNGEPVIDYIDEIIEHQKVFMEVVSETRKQTMMTFPVITYALLYQDNKFVDEEFAKWCNKQNLDWYDANFYIGSSVTNLSSCCRLISDTTKLEGFINSIGGTSLSVGSVKVNTINLRRIALASKRNKDKFFKLLEEKVITCIKTLDTVRSVLKRNIEKGLLPNYSNNLLELNKQYNTIGVTAMYETIKEFGYVSKDQFDNISYTEEGIKFATKILNTINEVKLDYETNYSINIEAVPAERANVVLSNKDSQLFKNKKQYPIYSNQWIPLMEKCTLNEKIKLGSILDKECNGGQISHINLDGPFSSEEQAWKMLNKIASSGIIYFAYNRKISVCEDEHAFYGDTCYCGKPKADEYSRVVGFLTPRSSYSKERKWEYDKRKWFTIGD